MKTLLAALFSLFLSAQVSAQSISPHNLTNQLPKVSASATVASYVPNAWSFNGTTSKIQRNSDLTANADGKLGIISFWYRNDTENANQIVAAAQGSFVEILNDTAGNWTIILLKVGGGDSVGSFGSTIVSHDGDGAWHHFMASWQGDASCLTHLYIDNIDRLSGTPTCANLDVDYTRSQHDVGSVGGSQLWGGCLSDVYINYAEYMDLSVAANRAKFLDPTGLDPVDLGSDGSIPTGTAPIIFLKDPAATAGTNSGTGGDYGVTAITACNNHP